MKNNSLAHVLVTATTLLVAGSALANPITATVFTNPGTTYNATSLYDFHTYGGNIGQSYGAMDGMLVTATFSDGTTNTATWGSVNFQAGRAAGDGWSLSMNGNSNWVPWVLVNNSDDKYITGLLLQGRPGLVAFDYVLGSVGVYGSPDSSYGLNLVDVNSLFPMGGVDGPDGLLVTGTYSDRLQVGGTWYGDLFLTLELEFTGAVGTNRLGLAPEEELLFASDTDNVKAIPEPASLALLGIGLLGLGYSRRRKL